MRILIVLLLSFLSLGRLQAQATVDAVTTYELDASHSNVLFTVSHLLISEVTGSFGEFQASLKASKPDFSDAVATMSIKTASINTDNAKRDEHLRSDDFFLAEKHPEITFVSKSFRKISDKKYVITGDLTMRGITRSVDLDAIYNGEVTDPWGNVKSAWKVTGRVNRFDYGLKWNALMEAGGAVVGQDVEIDINAQFLRKK